ncbi:Ankyrin repeat protein 1 [Giardia muris]|uniref:Ankyrin repeat protein 1 n=1 Tax=Giardia muris TaxID=5742 RepID=A0A4Z1SP30_GIAMU|nr:Ankyrin repeat protein 1 [Giardia muris]|eukprot:TNJ27390.1 Ankyrin repeat protein 1 [Giardia muris]
MSVTTASQWFDLIRREATGAVERTVDRFAGTRDAEGETALILAVRLQAVRLIPVLAPFEKGFTNQAGEMALQIAMDQGTLPCIQALLPYESHLRFVCGTTPLHYAASLDLTACLPQLAQYWGNYRDDKGETALDVAAQAGHPASVDLLMSSDQFGYEDIDNAVMMAEAAGHRDLAAEMRQRKAQMHRENIQPSPQYSYDTSPTPGQILKAINPNASLLSGTSRSGLTDSRECRRGATDRDPSKDRVYSSRSRTRDRAYDVEPTPSKPKRPETITIREMREMRVTESRGTRAARDVSPIDTEPPGQRVLAPNFPRELTTTVTSTETTDRSHLLEGTTGFVMPQLNCDCRSCKNVFRQLQSRIMILEEENKALYRRIASLTEKEPLPQFNFNPNDDLLTKIDKMLDDPPVFDPQPMNREEILSYTQERERKTQAATRGPVRESQYRVPSKAPSYPRRDPQEPRGDSEREHRQEYRRPQPIIDRVPHEAPYVEPYGREVSPTPAVDLIQSNYLERLQTPRTCSQITEISNFGKSGHTDVQNEVEVVSEVETVGKGRRSTSRKALKAQKGKAAMRELEANTNYSLEEPITPLLHQDDFGKQGQALLTESQLGRRALGHTTSLTPQPNFSMGEGAELGKKRSGSRSTSRKKRVC